MKPAHAIALATSAVIAPETAATRAGCLPDPKRPTTTPPPNAASASPRTLGSATVAMRRARSPADIAESARSIASREASAPKRAAMTRAETAPAT
ncbi:MAG: hypothetical protein KF782_12905 [Labilithrix sp.]|nr:hypothetical protein [Labilithrix sp.]